MSVDPRLLRSERFQEIGTLLQRDAGVIIDRWCRRAMEEQPNAPRVHHEVLRDRLAGLLLALGRSLAESDDPDNRPHRIPAIEHGEQRWESGWSLPELVRDYQILRLVLLDYLEETLERPPTYREVMAVGLVLDDAIAASVGMYVSNREAHARQVEREGDESLRRQAEALRESHRRKDEFLAILAHELRNPLGSILNFVEVLRLVGPSADPAMLAAREVVERQVRQIVRLVDDLLDVTRISQGKVELRKVRVELAGAVAQAIQTSAPLIEARQHTLSVNLPTEPLWLDADQARLVQVMVNLLNNAAKYTDPGGQIFLTGERAGAEAVIRVRDTDVGIPPENLGRIFGLFTQLDPSPDRSRGGLGVGLTLVRRLVEMHGGSVSAHSAGPGKGSEFAIRLPLWAGGGGEAQAPPARGPAPASARHVVIVEDDPDSRETLQTLLALSGHRVETAEDGPRGLQQVLASRPQVVLIDLGLPTLDGYEVARQIRAALGQGIFLVALTGFGQAEDRRRSEEAGFDAHLTKPVDLEELARLLAALPAPSGST
jgi:signal transduction histidine kinase